VIARLLMCAALACALLGASRPAGAAAHPLSTTAVLLTVEPNVVDGEIQVPIDRLAFALDQRLTAKSVMAPDELAALRAYVRKHTAVSSGWQIALTGGTVKTVDTVDHLVFDLTLTPDSGAVHDFQLHYDAILERVVSHRVFVSERIGDTGAYTLLGMLSWQTNKVTVPTAGASTTGGFKSAVSLGIHHISEGADHLLFLITLLLPAPLLARRRRWRRSDDLRGSVRRVIHVVTAFAIGHSITLALASLGYIHLPTRLVESLIALSILVSGLHAIRPLVPGGESWIAGGFGLMHGLAFAALIDELGLSRGSLVVNLLGFNLGIELTQLIVVALLMPSLILLSRTRLYTAVRTTIAGGAVVLAAAWLAERTTLLSNNPLNIVSDQLVAHPFAIASALAIVAGASWLIPNLRLPTPNLNARGAS
jgi:hypothetical protein